MRVVKLTLGDIIGKECPNGHTMCLSARCWNQDIGRSTISSARKKKAKNSMTGVEVNALTIATALIETISQTKVGSHLCFEANLKKKDVSNGDKILYINHSNMLMILKISEAITVTCIERSVKIVSTNTMTNMDFTYGILFVQNDQILKKIINKIQTHINTH